MTMGRAAGGPVLALDIGGSKVIAGVVDRNGKVSGRVQQPLASTDASGVLEVVVRLAHQAMAAGDVRAVGATIPGLADPSAGVWVFSPFSGIRNVPVVALLQDELRLPVAIENDVNACARGEMMFGSCSSTTDFVWVTISNGIGGCVVVGGRIVDGADNCAGEIGHIIVDEGGALCGCGHRGCAEATAAGPAILRRYHREKDASDDQALDARAIAELARGGDEVARRVFDETGVFLGKALASVVSLLNPQKVVLGGGVALSMDLFLPGVLRTLDELAFPAARRNVRIEGTKLGYDAALLGAASVAFAANRART